MSKLTLSVDDKVVSRAKRYAKKHGTSVSQLVQQFLDLLARPPKVKDDEDTPILRQLRGILNKADREDFRKHLAEKYR